MQQQAPGVTVKPVVLPQQWAKVPHMAEVVKQQGTRVMHLAAVAQEETAGSATEAVVVPHQGSNTRPKSRVREQVGAKVVLRAAGEKGQQPRARMMLRQAVSARR
jgi:hypothetical protein